MYEIARYFDDHFEKIVAKNLTQEDADKQVGKLNLNTAYVNYIVRKQKK